MVDFDKIRSDFPILQRSVYGKPLIYLDNAATSQKPEVVIEKVNQLHREVNANIHRGIHFLAESATEQYEGAREKVRRFIGAGSRSEIIFTSGATAAINLVAYSFGEQFFERGDNVVISRMEHHSNIVPWQLICQRKGVEVRVLDFDEDGRLQVEKLNDLIDHKTKIVALTQTSNVLGTNNDIKMMVSIAHAKNVPVLVDGCQGIVHNDIDVIDCDVDFYAFSGHKIYAPTGIGVLYGKERWLEQMPPFFGGGDMIATVSFEKGTTWAELPLKFEAGTSNFIGAIALGEALDYVEQFDKEQLENHLNELRRTFTDRLLERIEGVKIYGTTSNKAPIVSFTIDGTHPMDIAQIADKQGVAMRSGTHCAEPIMTFYGIESMCRASFAIYNNLHEVESAVCAIEKAAKMLK